MLGWAHQWCWWWLCQLGASALTLGRAPYQLAYPSCDALSQVGIGEIWMVNVGILGETPSGLGFSRKTRRGTTSGNTSISTRKFLFSPMSHNAKPAVKSWDFFPLWASPCCCRAHAHLPYGGVALRYICLFLWGCPSFDQALKPWSKVIWWSALLCWVLELYSGGSGFSWEDWLIFDLLYRHWIYFDAIFPSVFSFCLKLPFTFPLQNSKPQTLNVLPTPVLSLTSETWTWQVFQRE